MFEATFWLVILNGTPIIIIIVPRKPENRCSSKTVPAKLQEPCGGKSADEGKTIQRFDNRGPVNLPSCFEHCVPAVKGTPTNIGEKFSLIIPQC